ncbi:MAG: hypothetical protein ACE5HX_17070 [bacterium]
MRRSLSLLVIAMAIFFVTSLSAQSIWLDQSQENSIALEILKPNFDRDDYFTFISSALFLTGRFSLGENVIFVGELPFVHGGFDSDFGSESETIIGNPYVGFELHKQGSPGFAEIGVRIPLTPDENWASDVGIFSDFDRFEAFRTNILALTSMANYRNKSASNVVLRLRGGPSLLIYTGEGGDTDFWLAYSGQVGYEGEQVSVIGGLTGRFYISEGGGDLGNRTFHQLGVAASLGLGTVRPGIHFRIPIDDYLNNFIDFVFGFNLGIQFK